MPYHQSSPPPLAGQVGLLSRPRQAFFVLLVFITNTVGPFPLVQAQDFSLPVPGAMVHLSPSFHPPILKGIKVHPDNPFRFEFILDKGDSQSSNEQLKDESGKLIKYFLASLTIPEKDLWVNLSPYEKDRIVPESFGRTEMGRDLLAEDYMLKQITASLIYPEGEIGKKFWKRVYEEASKKFGTTNIPVNTFNKVWIVPEKAVIYENATAGTAYVVESKLKVMLEQDYLATKMGTSPNYSAMSKSNNWETSLFLRQILRGIVIPQLTKEVNEDKNFAQLRQVYNSLILATWYKKKIRDNILAQVYENKNKVAGVNIDDPQEKQKIYEKYIQAFKKGVYNYIKEEFDPATQDTKPRKYFSGGMTLLEVSGIEAFVNNQNISPAMISQMEGSDPAQLVDISVNLSRWGGNVIGVKALGGDAAMNVDLRSDGDVLLNALWDPDLTEGTVNYAFEGKNFIIATRRALRRKITGGNVVSLDKFRKGAIKDTQSAQPRPISPEIIASTMEKLTYLAHQVITVESYVQASFALRTGPEFAANELREYLKTRILLWDSKDLTPEEEYVVRWVVGRLREHFGGSLEKDPDTGVFVLRFDHDIDDEDARINAYLEAIQLSIVNDLKPAMRQAPTDVSHNRYVTTFFSDLQRQFAFGRLSSPDQVEAMLLRFIDGYNNSFGAVEGKLRQSPTFAGTGSQFKIEEETEIRNLLLQHGYILDRGLPINASNHQINYFPYVLYHIEEARAYSIGNNKQVVLLVRNVSSSINKKKQRLSKIEGFRGQIIDLSDIDQWTKERLRPFLWDDTRNFFEAEEPLLLKWRDMANRLMRKAFWGLEPNSQDVLDIVKRNRISRRLVQGFAYDPQRMIQSDYLFEAALLVEHLASQKQQMHGFMQQGLYEAAVAVARASSLPVMREVFREFYLKVQRRLPMEIFESSEPVDFKTLVPDEAMNASKGYDAAMMSVGDLPGKRLLRAGHFKDTEVWNEIFKILKTDIDRSHAKNPVIMFTGYLSSGKTNAAERFWRFLDGLQRKAENIHEKSFLRFLIRPYFRQIAARGVSVLIFPTRRNGINQINNYLSKIDPIVSLDRKIQSAHYDDHGNLHLKFADKELTVQEGTILIFDGSVVKNMLPKLNAVSVFFEAEPEQQRQWTFERIYRKYPSPGWIRSKSLYVKSRLSLAWRQWKFHLDVLDSYRDNCDYLIMIGNDGMVRMYKQEKKNDAAMKGHSTDLGGIDLSSDKALNIQNNGQGIQFHIDPAMLRQLQDAQGFVPVIISIRPLVDLRTFLGVV